MSEANKQARIEYLQSLVRERDATIQKLLGSEIPACERFDELVGRTTALILNMYRRKITAAGFDISFENYSDLTRGIEGEIIDFGTSVQRLPRAGAENAAPSEQRSECRPNSEFESRDGGQDYPDPADRWDGWPDRPSPSVTRPQEKTP